MGVLSRRQTKRLAQALLWGSAIMSGVFLVCALALPSAQAPTGKLYTYANPFTGSATASTAAPTTTIGRVTPALPAPDWERISLAFGWGLLCFASLWFLPCESGKSSQARQSPNFVHAPRHLRVVQKQDIPVANLDTFTSGINCRVAGRAALAGPQTHARCRPRPRFPTMGRMRMPPGNLS